MIVVRGTEHVSSDKYASAGIAVFIFLKRYPVYKSEV
jgi:hypothetical protein